MAKAIPDRTITILNGLGLQTPTGSTNKNGLGSGAWGLMPEMGVSYRFDNKRQLVEGA